MGIDYVLRVLAIWIDTVVYEYEIVFCVCSLVEEAGSNKIQGPVMEVYIRVNKVRESSAAE